MMVGRVVWLGRGYGIRATQLRDSAGLLPREEAGHRTSPMIARDRWCIFNILIVYQISLRLSSPNFAKNEPLSPLSGEYF